MEKKKRWLKERRKIILEEANILNPPTSNIDLAGIVKKGGAKPEEDAASTIGAAAAQRKLKYGIGKRMNLKEMLMLHKYT